MNILKSWFSRLVKKYPKDEEEEQKVLAYMTVGIADDGDTILSGDFVDADAMSQLIFVLFSGMLMEYVSELVNEKCSTKEEANKILECAYNNVCEYIDNENEDENNDPVVDPCNVFRNNRNGQKIIPEEMEE